MHKERAPNTFPTAGLFGCVCGDCALERPDMGLAAPHCHPAPPEAQGNSWGCLGPAVAMLVAIQRPKRAKSVPRQKGPKPCKSTLGGSRGMKPPQPMAQITQRGPWGVCELHRTTRGTSNKPTTLLSYCGRANHPGSRGLFQSLSDLMSASIPAFSAGPSVRCGCPN